MTSSGLKYNARPTVNSNVILEAVSAQDMFIHMFNEKCSMHNSVQWPNKMNQICIRHQLNHDANARHKLAAKSLTKDATEKQMPVRNVRRVRATHRHFQRNYTTAQPTQRSHNIAMNDTIQAAYLR